jgi:hypothetical protein
MNIKSFINITPNSVCLDGKDLCFQGKGHALITEIYRKYCNDYPKFFKMDMLSKVGFVASELLLNNEGNRFVEREDRAVVLLNKSASICDDIQYQKTIQSKDNYYPSPSVFVYTLPNIVTGEIAIRNKYYGETSFLVIDDFDSETIQEVIEMAFQDEETTSVLGGWLECKNENDFEALVFIVEKQGEDNQKQWNKENILRIRK